MTVPIERSRSVLETQKFLVALLDPKQTPRVPKAVRLWARRCLRHFPHTSDVVRAARLASDIFGEINNPYGIKDVD